MTTPNLRALLEKPSRVGNASPLASTAAPAATDEYEAYANGRIGNQPQLTLAFRTASGGVRAFSYSYLYGVESDDPANGFTLDFVHTKVQVAGQHLERLFRLVCDHRAVEIRELPRSQQMESQAREPVVEQIAFK